ncbi:hypothetical protein ACIBQ1_14095 [Nonomuraea sp. NPDC050153]|uniref:hypothetical protein n=1 Tax=Nonomuraea sp. NPDC050153 TaxID=3364359 RepID=UPI00378F8F11
MSIKSTHHEQGGSRSQRLFDIVRDVVEDVAPHELPLLAGLQRLDDAEISVRLTRSAKRDDPLGFGMGEIVVLVTPIVWAVLQRAADRVTDSALDGLQSRAAKLVRRLLRRPEPAALLPGFNPEALREIWENIVEKATESGMERPQAEQLANSVVSRLVMGGLGDGEA